MKGEWVAIFGREDLMRTMSPVVGGWVRGEAVLSLSSMLDCRILESEMMRLESVAKSLANCISPAVNPALRMRLLRMEVAIARSALESGCECLAFFFISVCSSWMILSTLALAFLLKLVSGRMSLMPTFESSSGGLRARDCSAGALSVRTQISSDLLIGVVV